MTLAAALAAALARDLPAGIDRLGVAVSGGGDSVALMVLLADWAKTSGLQIEVATVDHGLRAEAAAEAATVAQQAAALGLKQATLKLNHALPPGNVQANARAARFELLADWAAARQLPAVCLAHTMEDQAETFLLRLGRGSGVDGLAGMASVRRAPDDGPLWLRPLLDVRRETLRAFLRARGVDWIDDPSNTDTRFDRVRVRQSLSAGEFGQIDVPTLAETAHRLGAAKRVLCQAAYDAAKDILSVEQGSICLDSARFSALPDDTRWRLLSAALCRVGGHIYRPRLKSLHRAERAIAERRRHALSGCIIAVKQGQIWVDREPSALAAKRGPVPGVWDGRWYIEGPHRDDLHMAMLGPQGLAQRPGWRDAGLRRSAILTVPGIWRGDTLVAAPSLPESMIGAPDWRCLPVWDKISACADHCPD
ncbi:tRNA lysidine(34) synthetase TilS [Rhodobacteraceae bacterium SC52]|nr:tRNA lysidine(34) synthetase TilS [Rhodobacteraceae bacterium SC52]